MTDSNGSESGSLVVRDLTKDFAGLRAVDGVSFSVSPGEIMGLIGPNGSGKTTTINVVTGLLHITSGSVHLGPLDMTGWQPHKIARAGLARTFQIVRLFKDFTVRENVEVAVVASGGAKGKAASDRATRAMRQLGILHLAEHPARVLPQGEERLVEIARAIATQPRFLLLDEPGAGLNDAEIETFLPTLLGLRNAIECGVVIVDHDMRLIMNLCDRIHVLNYGKSIGDGTPDQIRNEPAVIEAYLGAEAVS